MRFRLGRRSKQGAPTILTETQIRRINLVFTAFAAIFVLVGGFIVVQGTFEWIRAADSTSWPTVPGIVTHSEVTTHRSTSKGRPRTSYGERIEFDYTVEGTTHHGTRRTYRVVASSESAAKEAVAAYPVGRSVTVSYDPQDPERAVLEPGWDWSNAIPIAVGLFAIAFVSFVHWLVVRQLRKAVQRAKDLQALGIDPMAIEALADDTTAGALASKAEPTAPASAAGLAEPTAPAKPSGPAELKPTFHDDLPGAR